MMCGIYGIRNLVNGKWYVGQSANVERRKACHFNLLKRQKHYNLHLQAAFDRNGEANFEFRFLEEIPVEMLDVREKNWIRYYQSDLSVFGYNLDSGGCATHQFSMETCRKLSEARKGRQISLRTRQKISETLSGRVLSKETRQRLSEVAKGRDMSVLCRKAAVVNRGRKLSVAHRRKLSESHKREKLSPGYRKKLSDIAKRRVYSLATRGKLSESMKRRHATKSRES